MLPTLDEIARDPHCATNLSPEISVKLLALAAAVESTLTAHLLSTTINGAGNGATSPTPAGDDQLLTVAEAATLLRRTSRWIFRNKARLPFVRRVGRRGLLCSKQGIATWLAGQRVKP